VVVDSLDLRKKRNDFDAITEHKATVSFRVMAIEMPDV
jgi:hypothetical protein